MKSYFLDVHNSNLSEDQRLHGVSQAQRVHQEQWRGAGEGQEGGRHVRLLHGGGLYRVQRREVLILNK